MFVGETAGVNDWYWSSRFLKSNACLDDGEIVLEGDRQSPVVALLGLSP